MSTCVVHLVWAPLGMQPLDDFLRSYDEHAAGAEHDLLFVLNGFDDVGEVGERLAGHQTLRLPEPVQDIAAYLAAARHADHDRIAFMNSYTRFRAGNWLRHLIAADADVAGASGSWGSHVDPILMELRVGRMRRHRAGWQETAGVGEPLTPRRVLDLVVALAKTRHKRFPAPHVRTNGWLVERRRLAHAEVRDKQDAYRFEAGLSTEESVVVSRDGTARRWRDWPKVDGFWQGDQGDLLITDNQTRLYDDASPRARLAMATYAWGREART